MKQYLLVDINVLPDVFLRVIRAKELLKEGKAANTSEAVRMAGVSRGAFYKYRNAVFPYDCGAGSAILNIQALLYDKPGVLMAFVSVFYELGANILTVNQSIPVNGKAIVTISARTDAMRVSQEELAKRLREVKGVKSVENILQSH